MHLQSQGDMHLHAGKQIIAFCLELKSKRYGLVFLKRYVMWWNKKGVDALVKKGIMFLWKNTLEFLCFIYVKEGRKLIMYANNTFALNLYNFTKNKLANILRFVLSPWYSLT